jgi:hypothetical protein
LERREEEIRHMEIIIFREKIEERVRKKRCIFV